MTRILLIVCAIAFLTPAVRAGDFVMDGNHLSTMCKNADGDTTSIVSGACIGFVIGAEAGYRLAHTWDGTQSLICRPNASTNLQMAKVVVKYMNDHPAELHKSGESLRTYIGIGTSDGGTSNVQCRLPVSRFAVSRHGCVPRPGLAVGFRFG